MTQKKKKCTPILSPNRLDPVFSQCRSCDFFQIFVNGINGSSSAVLTIEIQNRGPSDKPRE